MENRKIAIVHYTYPPVIGGVEIVIQAHARILVKNGYRVKVISGVGESENGIEVKIIPELRSLASFEETLDKKLKEGEVSKKFYQLKEEICLKLEDELRDVDVCVIHNIMTMHFNLPLTCALKQLMEKLSSRVTFYLWCHDSALMNPAYQKDMAQKDKYPWSILSEFIAQAEYITISELRQRELAALFSIDSELIQVVPAGIDLKSYLDISDSVWNFAQDKELFTSDIVMFFPSRILKRKNYELGIKVIKEIKKRGKKCKFIITSPPDPHNPGTINYFDYLHKLCRDLEVQEEVIFISDFKESYDLKLDFKEIKDFYSICDALFITSTQEGFGIPLLEAGAKKIPIICTDIEPFPEVTGDFALRVNLTEDIPQIATKILNYLNGIPTFSMFKRVTAHYSWEAIYENYVKKLVDEDAK
ncbi:glycosyltransferase family 4 protein [Candidatus Aerophobetes bacterium]|nr:glycosyltransferase family 4 protein [Candidatus Aerophobetes bacterium]